MSNGNLSIPQLDQYTVPIVSPTLAVKVAGFPGPFQVINLNNSATVWLGDNSQIRDGFGIPLNPGSSLTWTGSQQTKELWAILGTDSQSVGQTVNLIVGASVQGWQQNPVATAIAILNSGALVLDVPTTLLNTTTAIGGNMGSFAVDSYQSIFISMVKGALAFAASLTIEWYSDAALTILLSVDFYRWTAADQNQLLTSLPVRGSYMRVLLTVGQTTIFKLVASRRPYEAKSSYLNDRMLANGANAALGAGAVLTITPTVRYDGNAYVAVSAFAAGAAAQAIEVGGDDNVNGRPIFREQNPGVVVGGVTRAFIRGTVMIPRISWQFYVSNISAAAQNVTIGVYAAPEGT